MTDRYLLNDHKSDGFGLKVFENEKNDPNSMHHQGFITNQLTESFSNKLLRSCLRADYNTSIFGAKAHYFNSEPIRPMLGSVVDAVYKDFAKMLAMFNVKDSLVGTNLYAIKLSKSESIDWHQDSRKQAPMCCYILLQENPVQEAEGAVLELARVQYNEDGLPESNEIIHSSSSDTSGKVVFFNPSDLTLESRVTTNNSDNDVYLIYGVVGELNNADD